MIGIDDVARAAGVSTATVSRALSGRGTVSPATRERVLEVAHDLGYVVSSSASSLASGRTRNVGVVVPRLDRWYFSTFLSAASTVLARQGFDVTLYNLTADAVMRREIFDTFVRRGRVDGIIAAAVQLTDDESRRLDELGIPAIAVGGADPRLPSLAVDEVAVGRVATEHLIGLGHRAIAHVGASPGFDLDFRIPTSRRRGFDHAMAAAEIPVDAGLIEAADFTVGGGSLAAHRLLDRGAERPTAIFAASDEMAIGAILAARERGLSVPGDLSVLGIDGHELGRFFDLTTLDQSPARQAERAVETVLAAIDGDGAATASTALGFELIVRGSTGPAPDRSAGAL